MAQSSAPLENNGALYRLLSWTSWPALMTVCVAIFAYGHATGAYILAFNIAYVFLAHCLFQLERVMPFYAEWRRADGQLLSDIGHTITSKGTVQVLLVFSGIIGLTELMKPIGEPEPYGIWPRDWPFWLQVILGVYVGEFALYWAHRLSHEVPLFWRFHAVHHSVERLWIINTGRFHFVDSALSIVMGLTILAVCGAPLEVLQWLSAITAFIGILTHCNVDMKFGPLSYVFNTPELHHWHHSMDLREGNMNYGENVVIWDQLFGTYVNPKDRPPPVTIGIEEFMPPKFWQQLLWPFLSDEARRSIVTNQRPSSPPQSRTR